MSATNLRPEAPAGGTGDDVQARRFGHKLAGLFLVIAGILGLTGWFYLAHRQAGIRAAADRELSAIADLQLRQISNWREQRLSDARFFSRARFVSQDIRRLLDEPNSEASRAAVLDWLSLLKSQERYDAVMVLDVRGERLLGVPASRSEPAVNARELVERVRQSREVVMTDLHQDASNGWVHLDILFPIFEDADREQGKLMAAVLLKLDARRFLFPLIQSWPTLSQTAETLLVRQEGKDVLYLNDLRHRPSTAFRLRLPVGSADLPSARVLRGETGPIEGKDYRGVPVVAVGRKIPGTSWAMVAKVDREEIYAPLRQQMLTVASVLGSLLVASGLLVGLLWHQRSAQFLERELGDREAHAREIERLNRLYAALSQVNQAVVRARSREELLREMCRVLVQFGGLQMAWVGWLEATTSRVIPLAQFGDEGGYLQRVQVHADERPEGRGAVGGAIREGQPRVCNDILRDPKCLLWHEAAARSGWGSLAAFPIRQEGTIRGALTVCARHSGFFGPQEQALIAGAAADVSFGLGTLLNEQRRREGEEALRHSEERYRSLFENMLDGFAYCQMLFDGEGHAADFVYLEVNSAFGRLTGLENVVGKKATQAIPGIKEAHPELLEIYGRVAMTGQRERFEIEFKPLQAWLSVSVYGLERGYFVAVFENITERKRAEQALRQSEERFRTMADGMPQLAWVAQPDGRIVWYNRRWYEYTGTTAQQMEGWGWQSVHDPQVLPRVLDQLRASIATGQPFEMEFPLRGADGRFHPFLTRVMPLKDREGRLMCWFGTNTDVTDLVAARETLARSRVELERLVQERTAQLVEANASLQAFAYTAAHDLRAPLRGITSFSGIVLEECAPKIDEAQRFMLERIVQSAGQMNRLLEDLLQYSKMSAAELRMEKVSLQTAVGEALALQDADIRGKNAVVTVDERLPDIIGHPATVMLIVSNLVSNALKFMPPGVQARVRIRAEERTLEPQLAIRVVRLWVEDNGIGIAAADQEKLFSAFQRLHGKEAYPGTGLGLAIVRKGAERMGGKVGVESEAGKGSRFWVELKAAGAAG